MRKTKKAIALILASSLALSLAGCGTKKAEEDKAVKISFLNTKQDITQQVQDAVKEFTKANPDITIDVITTDQSPVEKASSLYAAGTPATLAMLDAGDVARFKDKAADLSNEKWVADLSQKSLVDGKTITFPFAVEGYGLIYNKEVLDKVAGGTFDPKTITSRDALEKLFSDIEAAGTAPIIIGSMDWSLGNHFLALSYATQSDNDVNKILDDLKAGKADYKNNTAFKDLMTTFDLMKKYNKAKDDPMAVTYEQSCASVAKGEAAMTFNGNWAMIEIQKTNPTGEFGFIPVAINNDTSNKANTSLAIGSTKQVYIDKEKSTEKQQEAAKKFLNWLVYEDAGQDYFVNKFNLITGFKNITIEPSTSLAQAIKGYNNEGLSLPFAGNYVPADHWKVLGASMQKYLVNNIDKDALAKEIEEYWQGIE